MMSPAGSTVYVRMFGSLCIELGDVVLGPRDLGGVKPKQLFEILLLARGTHVSKERLGDLLWGEKLPRNVAGTLETYVSVLRSRLGSSAGNGTGRHVILTQYGGYRIAPEAIRLDLDEFDRLMDKAERGDADVGELEHALTLMRGEVLDDEPYAEWAERDRDHYRDRHSEVIRLLAGRLIATAEHERAAALASRAVSIDPTDEMATRLLMVANYGMGRQRAVLRAYSACRDLLVAELGVEPLDETTDVLEAIKRHEPILGLLGYAGVAHGSDVAMSSAS